MHICEQMIKNAEYLENNGFTQEQLTSLHHSSLSGGVERYTSLKEYYSLNKNLQQRNLDYVNRVIYVASGSENKKGPFSQLISEALEKRPLT